MFFVRRLKNLGASVTTLREAYTLFVRPMLEYCAPLWTGALTQNKGLSQALERVQINFCKLVSPGHDYSASLHYLQLKKLSERRIDLSRKTALKMSQNPKFSHLFKTNNAKYKTRNCKQFIEPKWKSKRYGFSAIPFFIRLLNDE